MAAPRAWAQAAVQPTDGATPPSWFIFLVIFLVLLGALVALLMIRRLVADSKWSLSDALSEEVTTTALTADGQPLVGAGGTISVTELRASSSRLIALMGMVVTLLLFLEFGSVFMYRFAETGEAPAGTADAVKFLVDGLTLFAPYLVNKFASVFQPLSAKP